MQGVLVPVIGGMGICPAWLMTAYEIELAQSLIDGAQSSFKDLRDTHNKKKRT